MKAREEANNIENRKKKKKHNFRKRLNLRREA